MARNLTTLLPLPVCMEAVIWVGAAIAPGAVGVWLDPCSWELNCLSAAVWTTRKSSGSRLSELGLEQHHNLYCITVCLEKDILRWNEIGFMYIWTLCAESHSYCSTVKPTWETTAMRDHLSWGTTFSWQKVLNLIATEPVTKDNLSWETIFYCPMGWSFKTGSTV